MVLKYPYATEKATYGVENESKLQFLVDRDATKPEIKKAVEKMFGQQVTSVRTMMTTKGEKKAIIGFTNEKAAEEILSRLGIM
ncbi:50S ribosomal protein L23 [Methanospirillum lacunae]|uniref:Large ribosomal subunit protein uL23 n=1 Tax=Methanospirillum lacunae TaxID=668570 RepID=A0A2V2MXL7_9EURY|nr:50S ribosomal protein L23 [Methanospirillum lacunae]PWR71025.1 50S ribosomal protein L23 [Methanospirillum lacunae]